MSCSDSSCGWFIEIESPEEEELLPEWIDCYVIEDIDRALCGPLSKDLSAILPLRCPAANMTSNAIQFPRTDHLKRTRRRKASSSMLKIDHNEDIKSNDETHEYSLDVLVGSFAAVNASLDSAKATSQNTSSLLEKLAKYGLSDKSFIRQSLPGRPAKNKEERDKWNKRVWPTLFFEKKTSQYKQKEMALTCAEISMMKDGMQEALSDAMLGKKQWMEWKEHIESSYEYELSISGAVVINPQTGFVVSRASQERKLQGVNPDSDITAHAENQTWESFPDYQNPLSTAPLLAIQGVSRIERQVALSTGMESNEFRGGQYLCTGYDVYLTKEPNVFEAMSLVHSRVRRVVFGIPDEGMGGLGGAKSSSQDSGIHSLPGTNHHYRAFRLNLNACTDGCSFDDVTRKSIVQELLNLHPKKN